jgi:phosphoribosylformimino-5-aminoimidazole carboxamide ribotide isomerase
LRFRPCIDLHRGRVKQIVGGTLDDERDDAVVTNFEAGQSPDYYADLYWRDGLEGGHVIKLGPGNDAAARAALGAHPGNLQLGGGVTAANAAEWLDAGAAKVIVTSYAFLDGELAETRLEELRARVGREKLVLDLSCRRRGADYVVACDRWQTLTSVVLSAETFCYLAEYCAEFLVHAVDVEGRQAGIDADLVAHLANWCTVPVTYAGGVRSMADIEVIRRQGNAAVDYTVGSALDIFGGKGVRYSDLVDLDRAQR